MNKFIAGVVAGILISIGFMILMCPHPEHLDEYAS